MPRSLPPLLLLLPLAALSACDSGTTLPPPDPPSGVFSTTVQQDTAAPVLPPNSINQAIALDLTLLNDSDDAVEVAQGCGSLRATVQKQDGAAWQDVGTAGCDDGTAPLVVAPDDTSDAAVSFAVGALTADPLAGVYRLVLEARADGSLLPDSVRFSDSFTVTDTPLLTAAVRFAEGVVSTNDEEWRITFTPDGSTGYFARSDAFFPISRQATIYETRRVDGVWTTPTVVSFSGTYPDIDPFVTPDGERLFFSSIRPVDGLPRTDLDVWYVERDGDGWGEPIHTGALNTPTSDELYPSVADDGTLYVGSNRPGGLGGFDIWRATPDGTGYGPAANVGAPVNTTSWEFNPAISPDGTTLFFTGLSYPGGAGLGDLYFSVLDGGAWGAPTGLPMNTASDEYHPSFSPDRRLLFFVRRQTQGDLFVVSSSLAP